MFDRIFLSAAWSGFFLRSPDNGNFSFEITHTKPVDHAGDRPGDSLFDFGLCSRKRQKVFQGLNVPVVREK